MKKIIALIITLITAIAFISYFYFSKLNTHNSSNDLVLRAASVNASIVFSFENDKSFYDILSTQDLIQNIIGIDKSNALKQLKQAFINDRTLNNFIKNQPIYISVTPTENKGIDFLITAQISSDAELLIKKLTDKGFNIDMKKPLSNIKLNDSLNYYIGISNNLVLLSTAQEPIINALNGMKKESDFVNFIKSNSNKNRNTLANLYINYNECPSVLKNIVANGLKGELSIFNQQNSYAALTYNFSKEKLLFNGVTSLNDANNYFNLFNDFEGQKITINNILPDNTAYYTIYTFKNYINWQVGLNNWFAFNKTGKKNIQIIENIKSTYRVDLNQIFQKYTKKQFATFQLKSGEKLGAIALSNGEKVNQLLLDVSDEYSADVRLFKSDGILFNYFGEPFKKFNKPYYTIIDNHLVVANNASTVQSFLASYKANKLLIKTSSYLDALNELPSTANVSYYININNASNIFRNNIYLPYYKHLRAENGLKKFDTFIYQISADKNKFQTNILLKKEKLELTTDTL